MHDARGPVAKAKSGVALTVVEMGCDRECCKLREVQ
jgi:hypothetical protein